MHTYKGTLSSLYTEQTTFPKITFSLFMPGHKSFKEDNTNLAVCPAFEVNVPPSNGPNCFESIDWQTKKLLVFFLYFLG